MVVGDAGVIGFASVGPSRDEHEVGELYAIYVDPDAWSTGAGRALIERAEERLRDDYPEATLWVLEDNPRGLLMVQDEGVAWVRSMGQYKGGRGNDRQFWLSAWSGKACSRPRNRSRLAARSCCMSSAA